MHAVWKKSLKHEEMGYCDLSWNTAYCRARQFY